MNLWIFGCLVLVSVVEGGYYKVRAPPPPPPPPASLHYGPHPPNHYSHHLPPSSSGHYSGGPSHYHSPPHYHSPHHHAPLHPYPFYLPRKPYLHHPAREFHRPPSYPPSYPPKTNYVIPWKTASTFRAPIVKETFNPPPVTYTPSFIKDDDKGPIHTIPAPNLSLADKPSTFQSYQDPSNEALVAILKHGVQHVNVQHPQSYQVTEDPSVHQPHSGGPSYFAPDPDPNVPTLKVPETTDPKSQPSNGQVPLDLYLQQQNEALQSHQQQQNQQVDSANTLTAQDLFNLLNYQPNSVNVVPQTQIQDHVLPTLAVVPQQVVNFQQFTPQFQTFNYDEQTQQGAYGSDSFPSASMNLQVLQPEARKGVSDAEPKAPFESLKVAQDNEVANRDKNEIFKKSINSNEVNFNQIQNDEKINEKKEEPVYKNQVSSSKNPVGTYYTSLPNKKTAETLATLAAAGSINNGANPMPKQQSESKPELQSEEKLANNMKMEEVMKPEENVQLQKSIQIYETPYTNHESQTVKTEIDYNDYSQEESEEKGRSGEQVEGEHKFEYSPNSHNLVPYGFRTRPKRY